MLNQSVECKHCSFAQPTLRFILGKSSTSQRGFFSRCNLPACAAGKIKMGEDNTELGRDFIPYMYPKQPFGPLFHCSYKIHFTSIHRWQKCSWNFPESPSACSPEVINSCESPNSGWSTNTPPQKYTPVATNGWFTVRKATIGKEKTSTQTNQFLKFSSR